MDHTGVGQDHEEDVSVLAAAAWAAPSGANSALAHLVASRCLEAEFASCSQPSGFVVARGPSQPNEQIEL
jgi:hypothetical protein